MIVWEFRVCSPIGLSRSFFIGALPLLLFLDRFGSILDVASRATGIAGKKNATTLREGGDAFNLSRAV